MGCGNVKVGSAAVSQRPEYVRKLSVLDINAPYIPITVGSNVRFPSSGSTPILFVFGEYGFIFNV